jgi:hypothetical protein
MKNFYCYAQLGRQPSGEYVGEMNTSQRMEHDLWEVGLCYIHFNDTFCTTGTDINCNVMPKYGLISAPSLVEHCVMVNNRRDACVLQSTDFSSIKQEFVNIRYIPVCVTTLPEKLTIIFHESNGATIYAPYNAVSLELHFRERI